MATSRSASESSNNPSLTYVYRAMAVKTEKQEIERIVRCLTRIRGGIVALSPSRICHPMKTMIIRPNPSKHPQTLESRHGRVVPPHWRASRRQIIAHMSRKAPKRSICFIFSLVVMFEYCRSGLPKKKKTAATDTPPNGRLIQKHHLYMQISGNLCKDRPLQAHPCQLIGEYSA